MASQGEPHRPSVDGDLIALVRQLVADGKSFSIALEHPQDPIVETAKKQVRNFSLAQGDGNCIQWVYVPSRGLVCVKHSGT
jgi:hypothetical protein